MIIIITIIIILIIIIIKNSIHGYKKIVTIFEPTHQLFLVLSYGTAPGSMPNIALVRWPFLVLQQQQNLGRRCGTSKMHLSPPVA